MVKTNQGRGRVGSNKILTERRNKRKHTGFWIKWTHKGNQNKY